MFSPYDQEQLKALLLNPEDNSEFPSCRQPSHLGKEGSEVGPGGRSGFRPLEPGKGVQERAGRGWMWNGENGFMETSTSAGDYRELSMVTLRGEGCCGVGRASRDSAGFGAMEEGLISRGGRNLSLHMPSMSYMMLASLINIIC